VELQDALRFCGRVAINLGSKCPIARLLSAAPFRCGADVFREPSARFRDGVDRFRDPAVAIRGRSIPFRAGAAAIRRDADRKSAAAGPIRDAVGAIRGAVDAIRRAADPIRERCDSNISVSGSGYSMQRRIPSLRCPAARHRKIPFAQIRRRA
jgi:hypothetical protein